MAAPAAAAALVWGYRCIPPIPNIPPIPPIPDIPPTSPIPPIYRRYR